MNLLLVDQLEAVLDGPQEAVRRGEGRGVVGAHVAGVRQIGQCRQCRRRSDAVVVAPVHELQELHGELDVADPAPAPLHLALGELAAGQLVLGARLHGAQ